MVRKNVSDFDKLFKDSGLKYKVIAARMGMSQRVLWSKRKNPRKNFNVEELEKLSMVLNLDKTVVFDTVLKST